MKRLSIVIIFASVFALGCGGSKTAKLQGEITCDGKPVEEGTIVLIPAPGNTGPTTGCEIQNGRYEIDASKGPLVGVTYRVEINGLRKTGKTMPNPFLANAPPSDIKEAFLPEKYNKASELTVTISSKESENKVDFKLTSTSEKESKKN